MKSKQAENECKIQWIYLRLPFKSHKLGKIQSRFSIWIRKSTLKLQSYARCTIFELSYYFSSPMSFIFISIWGILCYSANENELHNILISPRYCCLIILPPECDFDCILKNSSLNAQMLKNYQS